MTQSERDVMLTRVDMSVNGNGTKGLHDRVNDLEDWKEKRPQECPAKKPSRAVILAQRGVEVGILTLIWAIAQTIGKAKGWW